MFKHTRDGYPKDGEYLYATHKTFNVCFEDFIHCRYNKLLGEDGEIIHNLDYDNMSIEEESLEFMYITEKESLDIINKLLNKE